MKNFQDTFERRKSSFISAFSVSMTVPLKWKCNNIPNLNYIQTKAI